MFSVGQEKHENGCGSQADDGCSAYVLHRHEGGLLHNLAFQYGGRDMPGITVPMILSVQPRASLSPILHYRLAEFEDGGGTLVAVMEQRWVCLVRPPLAAHLVVGVTMLAGEGVVDGDKALLKGESLDVGFDGIGLCSGLICTVFYHIVAIAEIVAFLAWLWSAGIPVMDRGHRALLPLGCGVSV